MNAFFETTNGFNFQIIDPLIESRGVRLTWFDCNFRDFAKNDKFRAFNFAKIDKRQT